MKRNILLVITMLLTLLPLHAQHKQPDKEKSEVEKFIQRVSRIKSAEIDYAYISTNMFKRMFAMVEKNIEVDNIFGSIKSVRQFETTGKEGYTTLTTALQPFLQEEEQVMGMELMALNREDGELSVIYSDKKSLLVIGDYNDETLNVVFIVGLSYETFIQFSPDSLNGLPLF